MNDRSDSLPSCIFFASYFHKYHHNVGNRPDHVLINLRKEEQDEPAAKLNFLSLTDPIAPQEI